jgi:hypothetical protein
MHKYFWLFSIYFAAIMGCQQKQASLILPDVKSSFTRQLLQKDSLLTVDSFYLVGIDTMTAKSSLFHQRFPYLHTLERINKEIDNTKKLIDRETPKPLYEDLQQMQTLEDEKKYVDSQIDSLNNLFHSSDSLKPVGYRAIYKVSVHKENGFAISDTIAYALSLNMQLSDWDRNVGNAIDSFAVGSHVMRGPFNIKSPAN